MMVVLSGFAVVREWSANAGLFAIDSCSVRLFWDSERLKCVAFLRCKRDALPTELTARHAGSGAIARFSGGVNGFGDGTGPATPAPALRLPATPLRRPAIMTLTQAMENMARSAATLPIGLGRCRRTDPFVDRARVDGICAGLGVEAGDQPLSRGVFAVSGAQRGLLNAQLALVTLKVDALTARVQLYQAMGGGWPPPSLASPADGRSEQSGQEIEQRADCGRGRNGDDPRHHHIAGHAPADRRRATRRTGPDHAAGDGVGGRNRNAQQ